MLNCLSEILGPGWSRTEEEEEEERGRVFPCEGAGRVRVMPDLDQVLEHTQNELSPWRDGPGMSQLS